MGSRLEKGQQTVKSGERKLKGLWLSFEPTHHSNGGGGSGGGGGGGGGGGVVVVVVVVVVVRHSDAQTSTHIGRIKTVIQRHRYFLICP